MQQRRPYLFSGTISAVKKLRFISLALILLLATAHRLPAPIQEIPENPTPAATIGPKAQATSKKSKSTPPESATKAKAAPKPSPAIAPPKFAGTWKGILNGAASGAVTIIVSPAEDAALIRGLPFWGDRKGRATIHGNTLSWPFMAESWTMIVAPDGKTATVTGHHWPGGSSSGTVEKIL